MNRRAAATLITATLIAVLSGSALAAQTVRLPSARDLIKKQLAAEQLLRGGRGPERTLPGRVEDREAVDVSIDPTGAIARVTAAQHLRLHGVGDYFFKVPGPVQDVEALATSSAQPGLRKGSVLWQGFATGHERLDALLTLVPEQERTRLPLRVSLTVLVDREPVTGREPVSGHLSLSLSLRNATESSTTTPIGSVSDSAVTPVLERVRSLLIDGKRPLPGTEGIPTSLPSSSVVKDEPVHPIAPLDVSAAIDLPKGSVAIASTAPHRGRHVSFNSVLSRTTGSARINLRADVTDMTLPRLTIEARPAPPPVSEATSSGDPFDRLVMVLSDVAELYFVDGYVGNPDKAGPTETAYRWTLVPAAADVPTGPRSPNGSNVDPNPAVIALTIVAGVVVVGGAVVAWSLL